MAWLRVEVEKPGSSSDVLVPVRCEKTHSSFLSPVTPTLGRTGIKVPIVGIGAVSYDQGICRRALDLGIRHIDTSSQYRNGNHEKMLGEALKGRPRDSFVIATLMNVPDTIIA